MLRSQDSSTATMPSLSSIYGFLIGRSYAAGDVEKTGTDTRIASHNFRKSIAGQLSLMMRGPGSTAWDIRAEQTEYDKQFVEGDLGRVHAKASTLPATAPS